MARVCDFTGKGTKSGQNRSHSMRATKRTFKPNLVYKWVTFEDGRKIRVKINAKLYKKMRGFV
ncbi:MAG TPA: 50S ribosomal protein L28 [Candidatus Absconditabacterales bacterium]|nr:50S ribosomal protein L28 [Candidatus Absconditabacterales bacterium]